ncbi:Ig-like domain-containing protein [Costertonia aggregata]|uniref:Choice-of-anchor D domain-containing protein n=1 Tax=Costertonia aggregata TaxID=343403 RepID=A0A7H9ATH6_9FLAO|nr:choice-of-anchor D domain-containing protein [Costertonia aggregata]QLG46726.1 choice-of-anchor D domain-containing protein [Costertonia aggregata]
MLKSYRIFTFILLFVFCGIQTAQAQKMEKLPGPIVVCPANYEDQHSRIAMSQMAAKKSSFSRTKKSATAELLVTFGPEAQSRPEVVAAFQFALDIWAEEIVSTVPIRIFAEFADLGPGVLASAGPTSIFRDFEGAPEPGVFYPAALANALAGVDLDPEEEFDLVVNLGNGIPWYFGTDGNTPAGLFDFVTVALHEAGHGLGFIDGGDVDNNGVGSLGFAGGVPIIFDIFVVDGDGNSVLDLPNPSQELGDFYTSGDVFVNGTNAVAALGGVLPELFAPNPFQGGSSIAHWDEATFPAGDPNSLMSPQVGASESNFNIGDITRAHFSDMGWQIAGAAPIAASPSSISDEINVDEISISELTVTNVSDQSVVVTPSVAPGSLIELFDPATITLDVSESAILQVQFNTTGITKGIYTDEIILTTEGFDRTVTIPVTLRVLDGTEAPMIGISPESFDETIDQFQVITRDLSIQNSGDDDLNYTITINNSDGISPVGFENRVTLTNNFIATEGFKTGNYGTNGAPKGLSSLITSHDGIFNSIVTNLFSGDFEEYALGNIDDQFGWFISAATEADDWVVTNTNPFEGNQHISSVSDGLGGNRLAFTPVITPGNEPFMVSSTRVNIQGSGTTWEVIPQSPAAGSVVTRVRFNADRSIDILDGGSSAFIPITAVTPEGYFDLRIIVDKDDAAMQVFFDDELVFSGTAFASEIEQVVFLTPMEAVGSTMDIDNVEIIDGDENAFFLTVSPTAGIVPFGTTETATVKFDARSLVPGVYNATINVASNDETNPNIEIPVTLTVQVPPTIGVTPDALSAAVDVRIDDPAIAERSFQITNTGESELNFTTGVGTTVFSPPSTNSANLIANMDMRKYGQGNTERFDKNRLKSIESKPNKKLKLLSAKNIELEKNARVFSDSIFYDTGINFPDDFIGFGDGTALAFAVKFDAESDFTLNAVRNAYQTEDLDEVSIILEVIRGGETPDLGQLLTSQVITQTSADGIFLEEILNEPQEFNAGESFWVVHKYPEGIDFSQGTFDTTSVRPDTYYASSDNGASYDNLDNFAFLTRALSGGDEGDYITLEPSSGTVAPGQSVEVSVSFDGSSLANGIFETDILVNSNDPVTPTAAVATSFEVSGQVSGIEVSDELLTFNDVFIGNENNRTFTISSTGLALLNIESITSDNPDFSVDLSSTVIPGGEEQEITVTFAPSTVGSINGIISIVSDAPDTDTIEVIVNGIGVDPPTAILDPSEVFEVVDTGKTVTTEITLRNDGSSPLVYSFPELTMAAALANPSAVISNNAELIEFSGFETKEKGIKDTRSGAKVLNSMGKDDEFGYTWIDSDEEGGPVYFPFDISTIGFELTEFVGADGTAELALPFPIEFYDSTYESLFVNANGFVSFQPPTSPFTFFNGQIPVDDGINNIIAGFWADLEPQEEGGSVHIAAFADAVVVQWTNAPIFFGNPEETVTFKIIILDDGTIDVFYDDVNAASFTDQGTVGIENADATDGAQVAFNTPYIKDGLALRFIRPEIPLTNFISDISSLSGVIPAGGSRNLTVTLDATDLSPDVYYDELNVSSNAPDKSTGTSLIELTVLDAPTVTNFTLINAETNEEVGPLEEGTIIDLANFASNSFSILASVGEVPVSSVIYDFNGTEGFKTENIAPFTLAGDLNGNFNSVVFPLGNNTVTATPYPERGGNGEAGKSLTINFEVIDTRVREITSFTLINADTDEEIGPLLEGDVIDLADFPSNSFSILASIGEAPVKSVVFDFNDTEGFKTENIAPYTLNGDLNGDFRSVSFPLGNNTVKATPFSESNGEGEVGNALTINFEVVDTRASEITSLTLINAETNEEVGPLLEGDIIDLADFASNNFSILASVGDLPVRSVIFDFNGTQGFKTESIVPFTLAGDRNGNFNSVSFPLGNNTVTATPFSERSGNGEAGTSLTINFEVVNSVENTSNSILNNGKVYPNPVENITQFTLEGTSNQTLKGTLHNMMGQLVKESFDFKVDEFGSAPLDMTTLPKGVYILNLRDVTGKTVSQVRIIKE